MTISFTWIPFYEEAATKLLNFQDRQPELITFLDTLREQGLKTTPLKDRDAQGARFKIEEIDPFTFFGSFNRQISEEQRIRICEKVKDFLKIESSAPQDFNGLPVLNNMKSWFISFKESRKSDDVEILWRVFRLGRCRVFLDTELGVGVFPQEVFHDEERCRGLGTGLPGAGRPKADRSRGGE